MLISLWDLHDYWIFSKYSHLFTYLATACNMFTKEVNSNCISNSLYLLLPKFSHYSSAVNCFSHYKIIEYTNIALQCRVHRSSAALLFTSACLSGTYLLIYAGCNGWMIPALIVALLPQSSLPLSVSKISIYTL